MTVRVAVIGCGRVAKHYRSILADASLRDVKVVGVADPDPAKRDEFAKHFGAVASPSVGECIEASRPDLVVIATPSGLHAEHTRTALEARCHVLVEKPAAMVPAEPVALVNAARRSLSLPVRARTVSNTWASALPVTCQCTRWLANSQNWLKMKLRGSLRISLHAS